MSYKKFNLYQGFTEETKTYSFSNAIVTWSRSGSSGNYTYTAYYDNLPNDFPATLQVADLFSGKYVVNSFTINNSTVTNKTCSFNATSSGRLKFSFSSATALKVTILSSIRVGANISYPVKNFKQKYKIYQSVTKTGFIDEGLISSWTRIGNSTTGYTYTKVISIPNCRKILTYSTPVVLDITSNAIIRTATTTISSDSSSLTISFTYDKAISYYGRVRVTILSLSYVPTHSFVPMSTLPGLAYIDLEDYVEVIKITSDNTGFTYKIENNSNRQITVEYYLSIQDTDGGEFDDNDAETISPGESSSYHLETDGYAISQAAVKFTITAENAQEYTYEEYQ